MINNFGARPAMRSGGLDTSYPFSPRPCSLIKFMPALVQAAERFPPPTRNVWADSTRTNARFAHGEHGAGPAHPLGSAPGLRGGEYES